MIQFQIAESLGVPLSTIRAMTEMEFIHWIAYFRIKQDGKS